MGSTCSTVRPVAPKCSFRPLPDGSPLCTPWTSRNLGPGQAETLREPSEGYWPDAGDRREEDAYRFRTPSAQGVLHTRAMGATRGLLNDLGMFLAPSRGPPSQSRRGLPAAGGPAPLDGVQGRLRAASGGAIRHRRRCLTAAPLVLHDVRRRRASSPFCGTLSDPVALRGRLGIPRSVPSGLPVER